MNPDESLQKQRIRERAYRLWEEDGGPSGRDLEYWERARALPRHADTASLVAQPGLLNAAFPEARHDPRPFSRCAPSPAAAFRRPA
ncbi:MAG: DUF2934 domain-containing protein [Acetobacteraceae bacterium]